MIQEPSTLTGGEEEVVVCDLGGTLLGGVVRRRERERERQRYGGGLDWHNQIFFEYIP